MSTPDVTEPSEGERLVNRFKVEISKQYNTEEDLEKIKSGIEMVRLTSDDGGGCMDIYCLSEVATMLQKTLPSIIDERRVIYLVRKDPPTPKT